MTEYRIPFNRVSLLGHESAYVEQALGHGHLAGDGPFSVRCQALLEEILGVEKALLTTSGTHALEMAALLLDIAPGDEVDRSVIHLRVDDQCVCDPRGRTGIRRHTLRHTQYR